MLYFQRAKHYCVVYCVGGCMSRFDQLVDERVSVFQEDKGNQEWVVSLVKLSHYANLRFLIYRIAPEISGFSTVHAYNYRTKREAELKGRQRNDMLISHKSTHVPAQQRLCAQIINECRISKRSILLLRRQREVGKLSQRILGI